MAIPTYDALMLPLLKLAGARNRLTLAEANDLLAQQFNLSDKDRRELLPSGQQFKFVNRVGWARTFLKKAGLLSAPERACIEITQRGSEVLKDPPHHIDIAYLMKYPEFREFRGKSNDGRLEDRTGTAEERTPEDSIESSFAAITDGLASEMLERIRIASPPFFERLVIDLLLRMGYGGSRRDAGQAIGRSGDGGIDGIIKEDKLGLDLIYVQAKRWENTVGRPDVQAFAGSLEGFRARRGVFITTSKFSIDACQYVERIEKRIILIDGERLVKLMIEHDVGVTKVGEYIVKKIDTDYFSEE